MSSQSEDKKLLVVQSNNGMYSVIHEMVFCDDVAWLKANQIPITGPGKPNLILQDCQVVNGNYLLICRDMPRFHSWCCVPMVYGAFVFYKIVYCGKIKT